MQEYQERASPEPQRQPSVDYNNQQPPAYQPPAYTDQQYEVQSSNDQAVSSAHPGYQDDPASNPFMNGDEDG